MFLAGQENFHAHLHFLVAAQMEIGKEMVDPRQQVVFVVRFGDEVIGPALEAFENILRVGERRQQDHGYIGQFRVGADAAAKLVTTHFRHVHVGDDEGWLADEHGLKGVPAITHRRYVEVVLLKDVLELLGLCGAVLRDEDFQGGIEVGGIHDVATRVFKALAMPCGGKM